MAFLGRFPCALIVGQNEGCSLDGEITLAEAEDTETSG